MIENNEDHIRRKKDKLLAKHFDILINDKKVKILNYLIKEYTSPNEKGWMIQLVSQFKLDHADRGEVIIKIATEKEEICIVGIWKGAWHSTGNHAVAYIIKESEGKRPAFLAELSTV